MSLRILWSANAPWAPTGYGIQGKYLLPRLRALGHEVANFAWYGLQGGMMNLDGMMIYPAVADMWGTDVVGAHCQHFKADVLISLQDNWVLPANYTERVHPTLWASWFPVDSDPIPEQVAAISRTADYPIVYSKFGLAQARNVGIEATYIPHGVDTKAFRPLNAQERAEARIKLGFPQDAFVCVMVAANKGYPSRKSFAENIQAFAEFRSRHPNAYLYLHTLATTQHGGVDIQRILHACNLPVECVKLVDQYSYVIGLPADYLTAMYGAADVLMAASMGEGFGIPIIEAQACGCPVITTNWTSMPELTFNGYTTQPVQRWWTPLNTWACVPSIANIIEALERIYTWQEDERLDHASFGVQKMCQDYDWDVCVSQYWAPFLERVEKDIRGGNHSDG